MRRSGIRRGSKVFWNWNNLQTQKGFDNPCFFRDDGGMPSSKKFDPAAPLDAKAKKALKSVGQRMRDDAVVSDDSPSEGSVQHMSLLLDKQELIKVRFGFGDGQERKQIAASISQTLQAQLVSVVGRTALLYRHNPKLPKDQRVFQ